MTRRVTTLAGSGKPGLRDGPASSSQLSEPSGLSLGPDNTLYIADTNNSVIRILRPAPGQHSHTSGGSSLSTLVLKGVPPPRVDPLSVIGSGNGAQEQGVEAGVTVVRAGGAVGASAGRLTVRVQLPEGYHLTEGAGSGVEATVLRSKTATTGVGGSSSGSSAGVTAAIVLKQSAGALLPMNAVSSGGRSNLVGGNDNNVGGAGGTEAVGSNIVEAVVEYGVVDAVAAEGARVRVLAKVYFCLDGGVCLFQRLAFEFLFSPATAGGVSDVVVTQRVSAPAPAPETVDF